MKVLMYMVNLMGCILMIMFSLYGFEMLNKHENYIKELELRYVVDYATEAAFNSSLKAVDLGIEYDDMEDVQVGPTMVREKFIDMICLGSNLELSDTNKRKIEDSIVFGVLAVNDGYYTLSLEEESEEVYDLKWSPKKPYLVTVVGNKVDASFDGLYAITLNNKRIYKAKDNGVIYMERPKYNENIDALNLNTLSIAAKNINESVNADMLRRMQVYQANKGKNLSFKLPTVAFKYEDVLFSRELKNKERSLEGLRGGVVRPTLVIGLEGYNPNEYEFFNTKYYSVGGYRTAKLDRYIGYEFGGTLFACSESVAKKRWGGKNNIAGIRLTGDYFDSQKEALKAGFIISH